MARHVFVVGTGSGVLGWVTDQSTVLVALGILKGTGWGGNGAWADVGRASTLGVAFWGTHGTFNASDGDLCMGINQTRKVHIINTKLTNELNNAWIRLTKPA